jgi:ABC-type multidrug transport system fused ATPase/permease subunit
VFRRIVPPLRNSDGPLFLESFVVAAVISFLGIRAFLTATGFPRVGGGELHIAHMLWGGALMLVALILLLSFLDRSVQHAAAIIAGLGFGTFVDEIGKFLTTDNDYLFQPAIALIYVIFVVIFLVGRAIAGRRVLTETEALANALDLLEGTLGERLEPEDRARIDVLLDASASDSELAAAVRSYLAKVPSRPDEEAWWERIPRWAAQRYAELASDPGFERVVSIAVIFYAGAAVLGSLLVIATARSADATQPLTVATLGQVFSTFAGAALIARGVIAMPRSHIEAYRWFLRGFLVWILVTQVFIFYQSQLAGLSGLAFDLAAYGTLRYAIRREAAPVMTRS